MNLKNFTFLILALICSSKVDAQFSDWLSTVTVSQSENGNHIELNWSEETQTTFTIERKELTSRDWETLSTNQSENSYVDSETTIGEKYEYRIFRNHSDGTSEYYFIYAGLEVPFDVNRGRLLLLVENSVVAALPSKIDRWIEDAEGDGYQVTKINIDSNQSVEDVKSLIRQEYESEEGLKSVFLLGHIPVPYSGLIVPDGHTNHYGAWATDYYYAEMDEGWTDYSVDNSVGVFEMTKNIPGDGKFDQSIIYDAELEVGRVDFYNLPTFAKTELELIEFYLDKNHAFKNKHFTPQNKALVYNTFAANFHAISDLNIPNIVGLENYEYLPYKENLLNNDYLWAYGAGGGSFTSASGVITTEDYATDSLKVVFNILFGSYFGDFNATNNLMRSSLGSGNILSTFWGNRPNWIIFHMGLGENIGLQAKLTQSDLGIYNPQNRPNGNSFSNNVHVSLLGDPTLRCHMITPIENLSVINSSQEVDISWEYTNTTEGTEFYIYVKSNQDIEYVLLDIVDYLTDSYSYVEDQRCGEVTYMVRAQMLQSTPSGSYYNQSIGKSGVADLPFIDQDSDGFCAYEDCDDTNPNINSVQVEILENGIDENCDGFIDEQDSDGDGYFDYEDCDDTAITINPSALEIPENGIDENCDGLDEFDPECISNIAGFIDYTTFFTELLSCNSLPLSLDHPGIFPNQMYVFPGVSEDFTFNINFCEGYDENEWVGLMSVYYYTQISNFPEIGDHIKTVSGCSMNLRFEKDGFYSGILLVIRDAINCDSPQTITPNGILELKCITDNDGDEYSDLEDCDDNNPDVNPGQVELPYNEIDDDCNPETLDDDLDQDGYLLVDDCDDDNPNINPGAEEIPNNGIDENCDGVDIVSSTHEIGNSQISIYPNPAINEIYIDVSGKILFQATLFDLNGKLISTSKNTNQIEVNSIQQGTYILEIRDLKTGQIVVEKVVVMK